MGPLKLKKGQYPDNVVTATGSIKIEHRNTVTEDDKVEALVSVAGPQYIHTFPNEMERLKNAEGEEVQCDALVEKW